jgi:hypothetical protein
MENTELEALRKLLQIINIIKYNRDNRITNDVGTIRDLWDIADECNNLQDKKELTNNCNHI